MIEQAQWIIDQLQDDPDLTGMTGSPVDNPDEIQIGPSGPELIDIDEIIGLDDPEITTPQADHRWVFQLSQRQSGYQWEKVHQTPSMN
jgi:hypothetical protein